MTEKYANEKVDEEGLWRGRRFLCSSNFPFLRNGKYWLADYLPSCQVEQAENFQTTALANIMADRRDVLQRVCMENLGGETLECQRQAVKRIPPLDGKDVFGVLPTRFGKSLIYQSYAFARNVLDGRPPILVIIPLRSIVQEQLRSNEFELEAVELTL